MQKEDAQSVAQNIALKIVEGREGERGAKIVKYKELKGIKRRKWDCTKKADENKGMKGEAEAMFNGRKSK